MCELLRPGITVLPFASMILVLGPRSVKISRSLPIAVIFPSVMATASTNEGIPFVAIFALYNIVSAGIKISLMAMSDMLQLVVLVASMTQDRQAEACRTISS